MSPNERSLSLALEHFARQHVDELVTPSENTTVLQCAYGRSEN